ncbi:MAG: thiamine pyrophosphate-binding protein, partial [Alphaproteobacteria bacterium]
THEQIAVSKAHGYAKASGKTGVCIRHNLVGLVNGSMGVYNAWGDHAPVVVLGGSGPLDPADRRWIDWLHCANQQSDIVKNYTKWSDDPTTAQSTVDSIARAFKIASTPPTGPVYVTIDCGIQEQKKAPGLRVPDMDYYLTAPPVAANPDALTKAADLLINAESPMIVGGRFGIDPAVTAPLVELVETTGAAYQDDLAIVCFPTGHGQNLSGDKPARMEANVILAIDCRDVSSMLDNYTGLKREVGAGSGRDCKVIDLSLNDMAQSAWTYYDGAQPPVDVQISAEPLFGMGQLNAAVKARLAGDSAAAERIAQRKTRLAERHDKLRAAQAKAAQTDWDATPIRPARMVHEVWEAVKGRDWLLTVRNQSSFPEGLWQFDGAGQFLGTNGGGGVGYGPGAAVGAAIANRNNDKFCVALMGDGDYVMSAGALWSAVHYRAPLLLVINNNTTWGNDEKHQLEVAAERGRPQENAWIGQRMLHPYIDHAMTARSYGAWAEGPVGDPNDLAAVMKRAVAEVDKGNVAVVEVATQLT